MKILFVCSSNVCRSPYCEMAFELMLEGAGLQDKVSVASAAVVNRVKALHPKARACLKALGVSDERLDAFKPAYKRDCKSRFEEADVIIGMSKMHGLFTPKKYRRKYMSISEAACGEYKPVPDPFMVKNQQVYNEKMKPLDVYLKQYLEKVKGLVAEDAE